MWGAGDFTLWATMRTPPGAALPGGSPVCDAAEPHNALGLRPEAQVNEFTETGSPTQAGLLSLSLFWGPLSPTDASEYFQSQFQAAECVGS